MSVISGAVGIAAYCYGFWSILTFFNWIVDLPMSDQVKKYFLNAKIDVGVVELSLQEAALKNIALFLPFAIAHVIFARPSFKQFMEKYFYGARFERPLNLVQAGALLQFMMLNWSPMPQLYAYKDPQWALFLEKVLPTIGFLIINLSTFQIDHFELFGLKQALEIPLPKVTFATNGFYKFVRHPIMTGMLLLINANALKSYGRLLFAGMVDIFILFTVYMFEEPELVRTLGNKYSNYMKTTPAYIPFTKFSSIKTGEKSKKEKLGIL